MLRDGWHCSQDDNTESALSETKIPNINEKILLFPSLFPNYIVHIPDLCLIFWPINILYCTINSSKTLLDIAKFQPLGVKRLLTHQQAAAKMTLPSQHYLRPKLWVTITQIQQEYEVNADWGLGLFTTPDYRKSSLWWRRRRSHY